MMLKSSSARILTLIICGALLYSNSLRGPFLYDDYSLIVNNPVLSDFSKIPYLFKDIFYLKTMGNFFRPLQILSYMLDYKIWGLNAFGFHITNVIIHILNAILLYFLACVFIKKASNAFLVAIFFLIHPVNVQAVSYISGRADLLACLFIFCALHSYIKFLDNKGKYFLILTFFFYITGVLSKEIAFIILPLSIYLRPLFKKSDLKGILPLFLILIAYLLLRIAGLSNFAALEITFKERFLSLPLIFFKYLGLIFLPFNLRLSYALNYIASLREAIFIITSISFVLVLAGLFFASRKSKAGKFGLMWYGVNFIFIANIFIPLNAPFAVHWLYIGLGGWLIFFIDFVQSLPYLLSPRREKYIKNAALAVLICFYSFLTLQRNSEYNDAVLFYKKEIRFTPANYKAHCNLGIEYINLKEYLLAEDEFLKAVSLKPDLYQAFFGLGYIKEMNADIENAIFYYRKALCIYPDFVEAKRRLSILE